MRTRAGYIKPAELFRYLEDIFAAHHVENKEKQVSFCNKMYKAQASNAPNSDPESWEEFKEMMPEELTQTLAGQEFCRFVCDIETDTEEDTDAENEELVQQGMVVFASVDARERLIKSPNWLLGGELKTFSIFKQVRIFNILRFPLLDADSNSFMDSSLSCPPHPPMGGLSPPSLPSFLTSLSSPSSGDLSRTLSATTSQSVCSLTWISQLQEPSFKSSVTSRSPSVGPGIEMPMNLAKRTGC